MLYHLFRLPRIISLSKFLPSRGRMPWFARTLRPGQGLRTVVVSFLYGDDFWCREFTFASTWRVPFRNGGGQHRYGRYKPQNNTVFHDSYTKMKIPVVIGSLGGILRKIYIQLRARLVLPCHGLCPSGLTP
jgi:hypothetical protein